MEGEVQLEETFWRSSQEGDAGGKQATINGPVRKMWGLMASVFALADS